MSLQISLKLKQYFLVLGIFKVKEKSGKKVENLKDFIIWKWAEERMRARWSDNVLCALLVVSWYRHYWTALLLAFTTTLKANQKAAAIAAVVVAIPITLLIFEFLRFFLVQLPTSRRCQKLHPIYLLHDFNNIQGKKHLKKQKHLQN